MTNHQGHDAATGGPPDRGHPGRGTPYGGIMGGNPYSPSHRSYGPPTIRTSAADREHVIDVLKAAYGDGRLTKDELDSRIERAMVPCTYAELAQIVADLPGGGWFAPPPPCAPPPPGPPQPRYYGHVRKPVNGLAVASLVCSLFGAFPPASLAAVVMGHAARGQTRRGAQRGYGVATAGMVIGYLTLAVYLLLMIAGAVAITHSGTAINPAGPAGP